MPLEPTVLRTVIQSALALSGPERETFLSGNESLTPAERMQIHKALSAIDECVNAGTKPKKGALGRGRRFVRWAKSPQGILVLLCVVSLIVSLGSVISWAVVSTLRLRSEYHEKIAHYSAAPKTIQQDLEDRIERWHENTYRHVAEQNANLFATSMTEVWHPTSAEQRKFVSDLARWGDPIKGRVPTNVESPLAMGYYAAWYWGMGNGFRRTKNFGKAIELLTNALSNATRAFGDANQLTIAIRTDLALVYHFVGKNEDAERTVREGDRHCREAIERDPSLLNILNGKQFDQHWSNLVAVLCLLPSPPDGPDPEVETWNRRIEICRSHPKHMKQQYQPDYEDGFRDALSVIGKDEQFRDDERVFRKQLARSVGLAVRNDSHRELREQILIRLATHLIKRNDGRLNEADTLLQEALQGVKPLYEGRGTTYTDSRNLVLETWERLYGEAVLAMADLYTVRERPHDVQQWQEAFQAHHAKMSRKYPRIVHPKNE